MKDLLNNIYDVLAGNSEYCTQEDFIGSIEYICVDEDNNCIRIESENGNYVLTLSKEE